MMKRVCLAISLIVFWSAAAGAAPVDPGTAGSIVSDAVSCAAAKRDVDKDRGRIEALMLSMADEDAKAETPARFKRMCAIDAEISSTAARLARVIKAAPGSCLSSEDREAVAEMRRLSKPVPECSASKQQQVKGKPKEKALAAGKASGLKRTAKLRPAAPAARSGSAAIVTPGLMSDLY